VAIRSHAAIYNQAVGTQIVSKTSTWKAVAFAAGLGLSMLSYPVHAAPSSSGDTVQGLYDALPGTMKNGRTLGQSGRFTQLDPSFAAASTSPRWRGWRSARPGPG
jgi:hypothetical protein